MQLPATARMFVDQRALVLGVLFAYLSCIGGCCALVDKTCRKMLHPRVCPTCNAHRINDCRCFSADDHVGYHETNWISLSAVERQVSDDQPVPEVILPADLPAASDLPIPETNSTAQERSTPLTTTPVQGPWRPQKHFAQPPHNTAAFVTDAVQPASSERLARPIAVRISDTTRVHETIKLEENGNDYFKP